MDLGHIVIPEKHPAFPHHFPDRPIVPGSILLEMLLDLVAENGFPVTSVKRCKFNGLVFPGAILEINIAERSESEWEVELLDKAVQVLSATLTRELSVIE